MQAPTTAGCDNRILWPFSVNAPVESTHKSMYSSWPKSAQPYEKYELIF